MVCSGEKAHSNGQMEPFIAESSKKTRSQARETTPGLMEALTREKCSTDSATARAPTLTRKRVSNTMATGSMACVTARVSYVTRMVRCTRDNGSEA